MRRVSASSWQRTHIKQASIGRASCISWLLGLDDQTDGVFRQKSLANDGSEISQCALWHWTDLASVLHAGVLVHRHDSRVNETFRGGQPNRDLATKDNAPRAGTPFQRSIHSSTSACEGGIARSGASFATDA